MTDRELAAGDIAGRFNVSRPAISQHIAVLKKAGLLTERREGVKRLYAADLSGLAGLRKFVDRYWAARLNSLKESAEQEYTGSSPGEGIGS